MGEIRVLANTVAARKTTALVVTWQQLEGHNRLGRASLLSAVAFAWFPFLPTTSRPETRDSQLNRRKNELPNPYWVDPLVRNLLL